MNISNGEFLFRNKYLKSITTAFKFKVLLGKFLGKMSSIQKMEPRRVKANLHQVRVGRNYIINKTYYECV